MIKIFIRHGQCMANLKNKNYSFETDEQDVLTEKGKLQAHTTALYLKSVLPRKTFVVSSSLTRAKQTSQIINDIINNSDPNFIRYSELLIEKSSIETFSDCNQRINHFLETLKNDTHLIVTHGHILEAIISDILDINISSKLLGVNNCGLTIIKDNQLITMNSISHFFDKELLT